MYSWALFVMRIMNDSQIVRAIKTIHDEEVLRRCLNTGFWVEYKNLDKIQKRG